MGFLVESPEPKKQRSKKDTKRWCIGKPGREHVPYWENAYWDWGYTIPREGEIPEVHVSQSKICLVCKKHLDWRSTTFQIINGVWTPKKSRW